MSVTTERLYYGDSYLREFPSVVAEVKEHNGETWIRLRESAFYPTSGGQPYDTGYLQVAEMSDHAAGVAPGEGDHAAAPDGSTAASEASEASEAVGSERDRIAVLAVEVDGDKVWHRVTGRLEVGQAVTGHIDWARRFDFMQQHSGQHILSACFEQALDANTTSFHMGDTSSSIDLDAASLSDEQLQRVMWEADRWIWRDVPIHARFVSEEELASMRLRKAPSVAENIRIVTIEGLEDNACGGTHPSSTGQVGQILVTKTERMRGGVRVTFVCGERALAAAKEAVDMLRDVAGDLSVGTPDVPDAVRSLRDQVKDSNKRYAELRDRYASLLARDFADHQTTRVGGTHVLVVALPDLDGVPYLKRLAASSSEWLEASHPGEPQLIAFAGDLGGRAHVFVQASEGAVEAADEIIKQVLPALNGKGGGNAKAAQGSAPTSAREVADAVEAVVSAAADAAGRREA